MNAKMMQGILSVIFSDHHFTKMKFSIKDFFRKLRIWSHLLKKSLMENFIFSAVIARSDSMND